MNSKLLGFALATVAVVGFSVVPVGSALAGKHKVPCYGLEKCKDSNCHGKNYVMKTKKRCKKAGGTTEEQKAKVE